MNTLSTPPIQLSVIIPVYNEEKYIRTLIESLLVDEGIEKEIFLVDGGSTDKTIDIIENFQKARKNIFLVPNFKKYVSPGFNQAFKLSRGRYVTLMGAHAHYPENFFKNGLKYLQHDECDVVGGPLKQEGKTKVGKAIAYAMSSKFGVGGTEFRTEKKKMYVDSVAFAIYKREIFDEIGLLDEELIRNQDDELHYRMNAAGFRVLMVPEMECVYYVRNSLSALFQQYYQYGYYKPLVLKKVRKGLRLRHLVPSMFCIYLFSIPFISWISLIWLVPLLVYIFAIISISLKSKLKFKQQFVLMAAFPTLHISYGAGFLFGLTKARKQK